MHFESLEAAEKAIQTLNGKAFNGMPVHIGHFIPKRERMAQSNAQYTNVYIKNLGDDVTEDMVKEVSTMPIILVVVMINVMHRSCSRPTTELFFP